MIPTSIRREEQSTSPIGFRVIAGRHQSVGRTAVEQVEKISLKAVQPT